MNVRILSLLFVLCLLLSACGSTPESPEFSDTAVTFTDDLGRSLTGGTVHATAEDAWDDLHLDLPETAVNLGHTKNLSLELLLEAEPDLILASLNTRQQVEWRETLETAGIPVAYFDVFDFEDYLRLLKICTDITGCGDRYETYGTAVQQEIQQVIEKSRLRLQTREAPKVLFLRAGSVIPINCHCCGLLYLLPGCYRLPTHI